MSLPPSKLSGSFSMNFAWVIAIACAFSMITITQAGNYTIVAVGKDGKLAFDPPLFVRFPPTSFALLADA